MLPYKESVINYGDNAHGIAIVTQPSDGALNSSKPMFVMFNSGLIHKQGPFQLNARLARKLAEQGVSSVRMDLSNKGDSALREGLSNRESVAKDWAALKLVLTGKYAAVNFIGFGLCSGADNALKTAADDASMLSLVLLDPVIPKDSMFAWRRFWLKLRANLSFSRLTSVLSNRFAKHSSSELDAASVEGLRDLPSEEDWKRYICSMDERDGRLLNVFTTYAFDYYNKPNQILNVYPKLKTVRYQERIWFDASHVYTDETHRSRLIQLICDWVKEG